MKVNKSKLQTLDIFQKEKDLFYLLTLIINTEKSLLYSDLESYIIGRSKEGLPTWIWTKEDINSNQIVELKKDLENFFMYGKNHFTCKNKMFKKLKKDYKTDDYFEMGFLSCKEVIPPVKGLGIFVRPNYTDKVTLAEYLRANSKETSDEDVSQIEALEQVEEWIESKRFYILKNNSGKIVCMAGYSTTDNMAKITHVYTPKEERCKGYCQYLIYKITKLLLEESLEPVLYTDYHYESSNKAYKNVGYEDGGYLINFSINYQGGGK